MTKDEFYDEIEDFYDLIGFCEDHGCSHIVQNIRESDSFNDWVWDVIENNRSRWFWHDVRDMLSRLDPPSSEYFSTPEGINDLVFGELWGDDLNGYKDDVADWGDDEGFWDEEDDWLSDIDLELFEENEDEAEDEDSGDECWDVSVDLSVLIGV